MQPVSPLNPPIKRLGLLVLVIGFGMLIAGITTIAFKTYDIRNFWRAITHYWNRPFRGLQYSDCCFLKHPTRSGGFFIACYLM